MLCKNVEYETWGQNFDLYLRPPAPSNGSGVEWADHNFTLKLQPNGGKYAQSEVLYGSHGGLSIGANSTT